MKAKDQKKFDEWMDALPDYHDCQKIYDDLGNVEARISTVTRAIEKADEEVLEQSGKPRSNETRIARNKATSDLKDQLAELEGQRAILAQKKAFTQMHKDIAYIINSYRSLERTGY